ncbi:MAG: hypothetical protein AMXMBFR64_35020 [Myxococcales bacterium]
MTEQQGSSSAILTRDQVAVFAAGLQYVAAVDHVTEDERAVIREFVTDAGYPDLIDGLDDLPFDIDQAVAALDTTFLRGLFIKACILLVRADGSISEEERGALRFLSSAFERNDDIDELERELAAETPEMP